MRVILAQPRGFCAGVERAVEIVELAIEKYGPPVYVRHEIVHNKRVVEKLRSIGARFVDELDEIPDGAITVFSAHGVSQKVADEAGLRELPVIDATCPLVAKVHREGQRYAEKGYDVILIGHEGHPEVEGTRGRIPGGVHLVSNVQDVDRLTVRNADKVAYITQTTLSVDDTRAIIEKLQERFPQVVGPDVRNICYATQNRQEAVVKLAQHVDLILVVGSSNSSNSNRLREIGAEMNVPSHLIDSADDIDPNWFAGKKTVGLTAGASAPEELVQQVIARLAEFGPLELQNLEGVEENVQFKLPNMLWDVAGSKYGKAHKPPERSPRTSHAAT
ncbi:MAG TPA: 4-hydroxy-3-methylbut-2-enyl diphosphate reductase [Dongiaceae bacterium]